MAKAGPGARDEADGLRQLSAVSGGPPVPEVVFADDELVVTLAVDETPRTPAHEESFGRALAALHATHLGHWGGGSSWIGACRVDASLWPDGAAFYGARLLELAARCGLEQPVGRVVSPTARPAPRPAAPRCCTAISGGATCCSARTAGPGSSIPRCTGATPRRTSRCSPCSAPVPDRLLEAYQEVAPLQPGWQERVALFQLYPLLVHAVLFGEGYRTQAEGVARRFG